MQVSFFFSPSRHSELESFSLSHSLFGTTSFFYTSHIFTYKDDRHEGQGRARGNGADAGGSHDEVVGPGRVPIQSGESDLGVVHMDLALQDLGLVGREMLEELLFRDVPRRRHHLGVGLFYGVGRHHARQALVVGGVAAVARRRLGGGAGRGGLLSRVFAGHDAGLFCRGRQLICRQLISRTGTLGEKKAVLTGEQTESRVVYNPRGTVVGQAKKKKEIKMKK